MSTYYTLQTLVIIVSALIPVINTMDPSIFDKNGYDIRILSAVFGSVVTASVAYIQLRKLLEAGIISRVIMAKLQKEYNSFMLKTDKYPDNDANRNNTFVDTIENMILSATSEYYDLFQSAHETHPRHSPSSNPSSNQESQPM